MDVKAKNENSSYGRNSRTDRVHKFNSASNSIRIALYSHDTMGLGHLRRNLTIAQALANSHLNADVLLITGVSTARFFSTPDGIDCLTLPALYKESGGEYRSRSLALPLNHMLSIRSKVIRGAIESFNPHLFIVDNVPRGVGGELDEALTFAAGQSSIRCVLGIRDILDEPQAVQREWKSRKNYSIARNCFDEIWVYGDKSFYNPIIEYGLKPDLAAKVRFTGYFDRNHQTNNAVSNHNSGSPTFEDLNLPPGKTVLCTVGGGQDGSRIVEKFSQVTLPTGYNGIIITGPYMSEAIRETLMARVSHHARWRILEFHEDPTALLPYVCGVISMAGYNSISEILSFGKPALIIPRVNPRREQLIRARRLQDMGYVKMCHPDTLNPQQIHDWLNGLDQPLPKPVIDLDFQGLSCLPEFAAELLDMWPNSMFA